ncbi:MAG: 5-oxoprolinase subunit PxpA, partial [Pseudomonadota bacterium]
VGNDSALWEIVNTANVACGAHGGDADTMLATCLAAHRNGVSIGAHPGFADLPGFGRRPLELAARQVEALCASQIGALRGVAAYAQTLTKSAADIAPQSEHHAAALSVTHVKAHGALNNMACVREDYAAAIVRAIAAIDPTLIHLVMPGTALERATDAAGLPKCLEAFVDRTYASDGTLTPRSQPDAMINDIDAAADRAVRMVTTQSLETTAGTQLKTTIHSLCVHGDGPHAVAMARKVRAALVGAGVELVGLPQLA